MNFNKIEHVGGVSFKGYWGQVMLLLVSLLFGGIICASAQQCSFTSPSDGSDGDYDLTGTPSGTIVYFKASDFHGNGVANNIFNFNKINIPTGVMVKFTENVFHGPVYWLATSDVTINGALHLTGDPAILGSSDPTIRQPSVGGSGGYPGGVGAVVQRTLSLPQAVVLAEA